jgi:hypothetical protein
MQYGLTRGLPIVPVRLGVSQPHRDYLARNLEAAPTDIVVSALIDTGASLTIVDSSVIERLGLTDRGFCYVRGFDGNLHAAPEAKEYLNYDASFAILADFVSGQEVVVSRALQVVGVDMGHSEFQVLLGRDFLRHCTLYLDLASEHFDVAPSTPYPI